MHKKEIDNELDLRRVLITKDVSRVLKACHEGFGGGGHRGKDL